MTPRMTFRAPALALTVALIGVAQLHAQVSPDSVRALNRVGRWAEAARVARNEIAKGRLSGADRCMMHTSLAYGEAHVVPADSARVTIAAARRACVGTPEASSAEQELAKLSHDLDSVVAKSRQSPPGVQRKPRDDGFWKTIPVANSGLDAAALEKHRALCERTGADACLVIYHDAIVQEWYSPRYESPMMAMSSTKSVAGLLTAMLIADGKIKSLDDRACQYINEWCTGVRGSVTLRQILSMTSGLPMLRDSSVGLTTDKNAFVLRMMPTKTPGTVWAYSNEGAQLMSPILDRAAGEPIQAYAQRRLFSHSA